MDKLNVLQNEVFTDPDKMFRDMTENEKRQAFCQLLVELHPKMLETIDKVDAETFMEFYEWADGSDWLENPDDTEMQKMHKSLMRTFVKDYKQRYDSQNKELKRTTNR